MVVLVGDVLFIIIVIVFIKLDFLTIRANRRPLDLLLGLVQRCLSERLLDLLYGDVA